MTRQCYCGEKLDAGLVINETDVSKRLDKNPCSLPPPPLLPITNSLAHTPSHATQKRNMLQTFLNVLSMSSNFLASSGSWALMSPPMKMLSRYIHFLCTTIHTWEGLEKAIPDSGYQILSATLHDIAVSLRRWWFFEIPTQVRLTMGTGRDFLRSFILSGFDV